MIRRVFNPPTFAAALGHLIAVLIFLRFGCEWGRLDGAAATLFHGLLAPGWLIYLLLGPGQIVSLLVAYPLNSLIWGVALAEAWRWRQERRMP
jgi:hypothetical protein